MLTGLVIGMVIVPLVLVVEPSVELFAMLNVKISSFAVVVGTLTVIPVGKPVIVPITGVTLVVPLYATTFVVNDVKATCPFSFALNEIFSLVRNAIDAGVPGLPGVPSAPSKAL